MTNAPLVWYVMRATGLVSLVLLTVSFGLGLATSVRWRPAGSRLYVTTTIHRNASLLAVVFLAVHVAVAVVDPDAAVRLAAVVFPVGGIWLVAGTLASDLVVALVVTSLLRRRMNHRTWRAIHWSAYGAWPLAVAHGFGLGSDATTWWYSSVAVGCIAALAGVVTWRTFGPEGAAAS
jgi:sulfoxide reductase heme-binding subunit YedZ